MRYGIFAASRLASVAFCDGATLVCYSWFSFYRTLVAKLPLHTQLLVLSQFVGACRSPLLKATGGTGPPGVTAATQQQLTDHTMAEWPDLLNTITVKAL